MPLQQQMAEVLYKDIRAVPTNSNPFTGLRPSAWLRITKGTLQSTIFATILSYGLTFNGFGIHTYYLQAVGEIPHCGPWKRLSTLGSLFCSFIGLTLPFFYLKQVVHGTIDRFTSAKPNMRRYLRYAFVDNLLTTGLCFPLFYLMSKRNIMAAARRSVLLCTFSMINDLTIEFRRRSFLQQNYTSRQIREMGAQQRIKDLKEKLNEKLKDKNIEVEQKRKIRKIDFEGLQKTFVESNLDSDQDRLDEARQNELAQLGLLVNEELISLKNIL